MPTTSKYVFVQKNSNGQYTTYGNVSKSISGGNSVNPMGNFVVLTTAEPMNEVKASTSSNTTGGGGTIIMSAPQNTITTTTATKVSNIAGGDNDDNELRPLAWLNDSNLIKGIVTSDGNQTIKTTTTAAAAAAATMLGKTSTNNICILNAADTHELIEELPHHVASEEHVATTVLAHVIDAAATNQNTHHDNQQQQQQQQHQQPIEVIINGDNNNSSSNNNNNSTHLGINDFQKQFIVNANKRFSLQPNTTYTMQQQQQPTQIQKFTYTNTNSESVFNNLPALAANATTTVHVGPSGTTTVVEYKTTGNFKSTTQKQKFFTTTPTTVATTSTINNNNNIKNYVTTSPNLLQTATTFEIIPQINNNNINYNNKQNLPQTTAINFVKNENTFNVANSNNNYGQKQNQQINTITSPNSNTNVASSSSSSSTTTTTHHPHKKYLREKMSVFKEYNNDEDNSTVSTTTTTTANILPPNNETLNLTTTINKNNNNNNNNNHNFNNLNELPNTTTNTTTTTYYNLVSSNMLGSTTTTTNNNLDSSSLASAAVSCSITPTVSTTTSTALTPNNLSTASASYVTVSNNDIPAYTIVNSHQIANPSLITLSEAGVVLSKEYYNVTNQKQQQQIQQQELLQQSDTQSLDLRSPTSFTSYDNDSIKDYETNTNLYVSQQQQQQHNTIMHNNNKTPKSRTSNGNANSNNTNNNSGNNAQQKHKHPNNVPYDPLVHTHNKPPYSFSSLIFMAIEGSNEKALPVKEIYAWIVAHFPYFKTAPTGWKNSVRHNLSLNKSFVKVEKAPNMGKGSLWRVEPLQRQNLIQALTRSPFFPNSSVDKIATKSNMISMDEDSAPSTPHTVEEEIMNKPITNANASANASVTVATSNNNVNARFDPRLFPNLSKAFSDMSEHNNVLNDVSEIPSDYSTNNKQKQQNNNNNHNIDGNFNKNNNIDEVDNGRLPNNIQKKLKQNGGMELVENHTSNPMPHMIINGHFTQYESLEHLTRDCGADSLDDVNAATAMLALKHGPKIFSETFHTSAPVITSSPSEDHTYSAGGSSNAGSGASTPLMLNNSMVTPLIINLNGNGSQQQRVNGCDSQSNGASSEDAAYESCEENPNMSPEELEDQQRHRDGVDALLSLSLSSSVLDSSPNTSSLSSAYSPVKRAYMSMEDEHVLSNYERNNNLSPSQAKNFHARQHNHQEQQTLSEMSLIQNQNYYHQGQQQEAHLVLSEVPAHHVSSAVKHNNYQVVTNQEEYQTQRRHYQTNAQNLSYASTSSPPKKMKQMRSLRTKIKRKPSWIR